MYSYRAYGLTIQSNLSLPAFPPASGPADLEVRLLDSEAEPDLLPDEPGVEFAGPDVFLSFKRVGIFRVRDGRHVEIKAARGADASLVRLYLVGKVLATALYQRGLLVLHASCVEVDGRAVAFMGTSLFGKSSVAASLMTCRHQLIADDVTALDMSSDRPLAVPAFPQLKLDPAVADLLGYDRAALEPLYEFEMRQGLRAKDNFVDGPRPLALIYLLSPGEGERQLLPRQQTLAELIRHSFPARLQRSGGAPHLHQCARLMTVVPVLRLPLQQARARSEALSRRVREDLASMATSPSPQAPARIT